MKVTPAKAESQARACIAELEKHSCEPGSMVRPAQKTPLQADDLTDILTHDGQHPQSRRAIIGAMRTGPPGPGCAAIDRKKHPGSARFGRPKQSFR